MLVFFQKGMRWMTANLAKKRAWHVLQSLEYYLRYIGSSTLKITFKSQSIEVSINPVNEIIYEPIGTLV